MRQFLHSHRKLVSVSRQKPLFDDEVFRVDKNRALYLGLFWLNFTRTRRQSFCSACFADMT